ncbi:hypothetical protein HDU82_006539 [Entophlyctis luteolus]|nr:hypothetical protein HDU82_006539 [Entophlyctis luteolus]
MTTAARPTWLPAVGGGSLRDTGGAPILQKSAKDQTAHTKMKLRQPAALLDREEMKLRLLAAERSAKGGGILPASTETSASVDVEALEDKRRQLLAANLDADDDDDDDDGQDSNNEGAADLKDNERDDSDTDSDDDDTQELMRELEKIKRERAEEKERQEREAQERREAEMLAGNPLLNATGSSSNSGGGAATGAVVAAGGFAVKRRWDDDVVFRNQARGVDAGRPKKRFINDLLRSDFHRKFMSKYVR